MYPRREGFAFDREWPIFFVALVLQPTVLLLTGALSVAGSVRRALHVDPANVLREQ
jgi:hypothetical protein